MCEDDYEDLIAEKKFIIQDVTSTHVYMSN